MSESESILHALRDEVVSLREQVNHLARIVNRDSIKYTVKEAADRLKRSERSVWNLIRNGSLDSFIEQGRRIITEDAIQSWEHRNRIPG